MGSIPWLCWTVSEAIEVGRHGLAKGTQDGETGRQHLEEAEKQIRLGELAIRDGPDDQVSPLEPSPVRRAVHRSTNRGPAGAERAE